MARSTSRICSVVTAGMGLPWTSCQVRFGIGCSCCERWLSPRYGDPGGNPYRSSTVVVPSGLTDRT
jgi:hypothetical protein